MSFNLIIVKSPSYRGRQSQEIIEAIMSLALFDVEHKVVFFEQGLQWLITNQESGSQKSIEKQSKALPIYGSEDIFYCEEHKTSFSTNVKFNDLAESVSLSDLANWVHEAKHVEVF